MFNRERYIVSPIYDNLFFIWTPLLFLGAAGLFQLSGFLDMRIPVGGGKTYSGNYILYAFAYMLTMSHLVAAFYRSHLNKSIFVRFPIRFTVVPVLFLLGLYFFRSFYLLMLVFIPWFDIYHSSLQTFGLGRIYDMRAKNNPLTGRRLDYILALFTYAGPVLGGAAFYRHINSFRHFDGLGLETLASVPGWAMLNQKLMTLYLVLGFAFFISYYLFAYWVDARRGYNVSWQKVWLHVSLATCSFFAWGFNSFGQAFFIMESYHAVQYFALVWWSEKGNLQTIFRLNARAGGRAFTFCIYMLIPISFGVFAQFGGGFIEILLLAEFLHYWYDGFIWSVRKHQVA